VTAVPGVGVPADLETPALVVDIGRVQANIERLQGTLTARGIGLRPHVKTHKSVRIGQLQLDAGARGLTVGTLGEAEVFAAAGVRDQFLAYPLWAEGSKAGRLRDVHDAVELSVGIDSAAGAERLAAAVRGARRPLRVLVEIDPGQHRSGVAPEDAVEVARAARTAGLAVDGVFSHGGHGYRPGGPEPAGADEVRLLAEAADALRAAGFSPSVVSAGSTPTMITAAVSPVTEIRAGTYALGDRQQWTIGAIPAEGCAAVVAGTVVSVHADRYVVDAGAKSLTKDRADWLPGFGHLPDRPDAVIASLSDYHGVVRDPSGAASPRLGEVLPIVPNHICPVVDLYDDFVAVLPDGTAERWPVDARGRSR
jgi:D-serine deaminase-like pyridoxal phosphate-dependent protein